MSAPCGRSGGFESLNDHTSHSDVWSDDSDISTCVVGCGNPL
jgi:hypothetical protein